MSDFKREKHNPIELIHNYWPAANTDHIIYDPNLKKGQYDIIRQSSGDGTLLFTIEMLQKGLINILNKQSFYKPTEPKDWSKVKDVKYIVGAMRHATVFGKVLLGCSKTHKYLGLKERIRMPVIVEYIY